MFTLFFIPHQNISREARTTWCHYPTNPQPLPRFAQKNARSAYILIILFIGNQKKHIFQP